VYELPRPMSSDVGTVLCGIVVINGLKNLEILPATGMED